MSLQRTVVIDIWKQDNMVLGGCVEQVLDSKMRIYKIGKANLAEWRGGNTFTTHSHPQVFA
jgi:hypothetical protein